MTKPQLPIDFVKRCKKITAKRPRTVITHILKYGFITSQELKDKYGYNHPPRAVRDVKENGIPIEMFRVKGTDGRKIAAYRFGDPIEVAGDMAKGKQKPENFMLLCGSANRAKSWSCEHCVNWLEQKDSNICRSCYWAYPEENAHIAMRPVRRLDIMWTGAEVEVYDKLKKKTAALQQEMPSYVKKIIKRNL